MKLKIFNLKNILPKLGLVLCCLVIAFIGFEVRGFLPFDPLISYSSSAKVTEFVLTHTSFANSFSSPQTCLDYKEVVRLMGETWPNHSYGQEEYYAGPNPLDPLAKELSLIERGVSFSDAGVVKWRYQNNEPYIAFELADDWSDYFTNEKGKSTSVQQISDTIPQFRKLMEAKGFVFSEPNNIPLYRYPEGSFARKIGFTKGNFLYHFTIVEEESPNDPSIPKEDLPTGFQKPVRIAMNCAENSPELRAVYEQYLSQSHGFTNETSVVYGGRKDNLAHFTLYYPGGVTDQTQDEFYDLRKNPMRLVTKANNFTLCSTFEKLKIGKDYPCYRPENKEFSVVSY